MAHVTVWTSLTSPNYCCYTTLWKSKHRKCNITAGYHQRKLHQMYHSFIKVDQGHHVPYIYLFGVLYSKACMKQRFTTSTTCKNTWCKLVLTLTGTSSMLAWPSTIVCMLVVNTLSACSDLNVHLYDSPEHFMKLSNYFAVNIKSWSCVHMHFWLFDFHRVV